VAGVAGAVPAQMIRSSAIGADFVKEVPIRESLDNDAPASTIELFATTDPHQFISRFPSVGGHIPDIQLQPASAVSVSSCSGGTSGCLSYGQAFNWRLEGVLDYSIGSSTFRPNPGPLGTSLHQQTGTLGQLNSCTFLNDCVLQHQWVHIASGVSLHRQDNLLPDATTFPRAKAQASTAPPLIVAPQVPLIDGARTKEKGESVD